MVKWAPMAQRTVPTITGKPMTTCSCLHQRSLPTIGSTKGFTLIEVLIVVLLIGILCGAGVSIYSGVTQSAQIQTVTDELQSFFYACRHRASIRKMPVNILYHDQTFSIEQSGALRLRVPEMDSPAATQAIGGLQVNQHGVFSHKGQPINKLILPIKMSGNRIATITVNL